MATEPQWSIAYSALFLDEKESFETAETQINENIDEAAAVGKDPSDIYIAVDIIATEAQIAAWHVLVRVLRARYRIPAERVYAHNWIDYKDARYCEGCALATLAREWEK